MPEDKRKKILDIAIDEFAEHPYKAVSISRIVRRAGIAKGSFYQYFEDKADLYLFLIEMFTAEKMAFAGQNPPPDRAATIFEHLRWLGEASATFELSHPGLAHVSYRALYEDVPLPEETMLRIREGSYSFFLKFVREGIEKGSIDPQVDPEMAAVVFNAISLNLGKQMIDRLGIKIEEVVRRERQPLDSAEGRRMWENLIYILQHGMGVKK